MNGNSLSQIMRILNINLFVGIHPFDTEEEMHQFFQRNKNNRDFAVIFKQDGSNGQLNYTIRTRNNNFHTDQIFLNNIYEIGSRSNVSN